MNPLRPVQTLTTMRRTASNCAHSFTPSTALIEHLSNFNANCNASGVICRLRGGLGNQLFQYAAGTVVASRAGVPLSVCLGAFNEFKLKASDWRRPRRRPDLLQFFPEVPIDPDPDLAGYVSIRMARKRLWTASAWAAALSPNMIGVEMQNRAELTGKSGNRLYLDGYWQSADIAALALGSWDIPRLKSRSQAHAAATDTFKRLFSGARTHGIHVRRGDYVSNMYDTTALPTDYYSRALGRMDSDATIIFSDDISWCKANLHSPHLHFWEESDPIQTFWALGMCDHITISNSTFSWWSAAMSGSSTTVTAPREWYRTESPYAGTENHLLPKAWQRAEA